MDNKSILSADAPAIACSLSAEQQAARERELATTIFANAQQREELADGYALRFAGDESSAGLLLEFITFERVCCPFFTFELLFEANQGAIWLRLRGPEGVKAALQAEWPALLVAPTQLGLLP